MLENKTISSIAVEESITTSTVFDTGWVRERGRGVDLQTNLYRNNTSRMLMWSFEMVSISNSVLESAHFQPYLIDTEAVTHAMETRYSWSTHAQSSGGEWYLNYPSYAGIGNYRFSLIPSHDGGKWNMLPVGFGVDIMQHVAMQSSDVIDYKLTVVEEDTSLLVNRN